MSILSGGNYTFFYIFNIYSHEFIFLKNTFVHNLIFIHLNKNFMKTFNLKRLLILVLAVVSLQGFAQKVNLEENLPVDPDVIIGTLDNGMKYYIRSNSEPKNRARFGIAMNVGSILEDDDQRGFAHFCEHMCFNGTKNFPDKGIIEYFEKIGMKFGREINAYTSFDKTVYELTLPTDNEEYLAKGLLTLHDWASANTDSDKEIDAERGVINEERRGRLNASGRIRRQWFPVVLFDSKYNSRFPIGTEEIIMNGKPEALRRFRKDWYRPDLQALVLVGDFDAQNMEKKVKELFSEIPKQENARKRYYAEIPDHNATFVVNCTDPEQTSTSASVMYKYDYQIMKTKGDYRNSIIKNLYNSMLNKRFSIMAQDPETPFMSAGVSNSRLIGKKSAFQVSVSAKNGKLKESLTAALRENERALQFGFTADEIKRTKNSMKKGWENYMKELKNRSSSSFYNSYINNYSMTESPIPSAEDQYELFKIFIEDITPEEIQTVGKKYTTETNRVIMIIAPEKDKDKLPTQAETLTILDDSKKEKIEAYKEEKIADRLMKKKPKKGKIKSEKVLDVFGGNVTELVLSNGIKVYLKPTDFKDNQIIMSAYSYGGTSLYKNEDLLSAQWASGLINSSGLGEFDAIQLGKYLSDKSANVGPRISGMSEGFSGSSSIKDFETMLQMLHMYFTSPREDKKKFGVMVEKSRLRLENKGLNPMSEWRDTMTVVASNYHPRVKPMSVERLKELDFEKIHKIYNERFENPSDFTFFFVGNIDIKKTKKLLARYLGGLKGNPDKKESWFDHKIRPPKGITKRVTYGSKENKAIVVFKFEGDMKYTLKNRLTMNALGKALSHELLMNIREKLGGVYSIGARPSISHYPEEIGGISVSFVTNPERVDELSKAVFAEIKKMQTDGVNSEYFKKVIKQIKRSRETSVRKNGYWLGTMKSYSFNNTDFKEYDTYNDVLESVTNEDIKKLANQVIDFNQYMNFIFMPKDMNPDSAKK